MTPSTITRRTPARPIPSEIPATMRPAAIDRFGGSEVLSGHTLPVPEPNAQEVLIAVDAAGVGTRAASQRAGVWVEGDEDFPLSLGIAGAGTIVPVAARVHR